MNPKISIIVPCYKVEQYLDRCMQSLLNQALKNIEIILIDDGSPDNIPVMCDNYAKNDNRVKVIHKKNSGLGLARNSGLDIASGEYVAFVDSDDFVDIEMYLSLYEKANQNNCDAVFCSYYIEKRNGRGWIRSNEIEKDTMFLGKEIDLFMLDMIASSPSEIIDRRYAMSVWHAIYKREIIENSYIRFLSEREIASEDIPFQISFLKRSHRIEYINQAYYYYCNNSNSLTATFKKEKFYNFLRLYDILSEEVKHLPDGQIRCDRLFLGYTRSQLLRLTNSNMSNKLAYLREICNNLVWEKISTRYKINFVRNRFQKWFYKLLLKKNINLLYLYCSFAAKIKNFSQ